MKMTPLSSTAIPLLSMVGLAANLWWWQTPLVGAPLFFVFFFLLGNHLATRLPQHIHSFRRYWGYVLAGSVLTILTTTTYYLFALTPLSCSVILILLSLLFLLPKKIPAPPIHIQSTQGFPFRITTFIAISIAAFLLVTLFMNTTTDILISPWQTLEPWFFILYATGIAATIVACVHAKHHYERITLTSLYLFLAFSIAAIIYVYGFGFDGFIHRATEEWIVQNGFIAPKTPYYIGQYSLIAFLSLMSALPVFLLDTYLVPVLAAIMIPPAVTYALRSWSVPAWLATSGSVVVPFLYFITLNLTTPHNVVLLLFIVIIFSLLAAYHQHLPFALPLLLSFVALITHPLLGAALVIITLCAWGYTKGRYSNIILGTSAILIALLPSILFSFNNYLGGFGLPQLINPFTKTALFFSLFDRPYWYAASSTFFLDTLYAYQRAIAPIVIGLAIIGSWYAKEKKVLVLLWMGFFSFIVAAWFLRTWLFFPNVAAAEQDNYPLRFLWASMLFVLPLSIYGIHHILEQLRRLSFTRHTIVRILGAGTVGILLMISLYFSYPQRNPKIFFPGYNVSDADFHAVEWIHTRQGNDDNYIVLANSLTSIAALTKYSFAKHFNTTQGELFYYAIPTGGPLYGYYDKLLYEGQKRSDMQAALELTGAQTGYFVVSSFWSKYADIVNGAKQSANEWQSIDNGKMHIFIYTRDSEQ